MYNFSFHTFFVSNYVIVENLQVSWHSLVYRLFQAKVSIGYDEGRKFHFFKCASKNCKGKVQKSVQCYLDLKDCAAMSNLKSHALRCFSQDLVESAFEIKQSEG